MMKVYYINGSAAGSSWTICKSTMIFLKKSGCSIRIATPSFRPLDIDKDEYFRIGNRFSRCINRILTHIDGSDGFRNNLQTKRLINDITNFSPDIVHLHTLHGYFVNVRMLLKYLKKNNIKTIITMHDCWWITGRCAHFYSNCCDEWKNGCVNCKYKESYPSSMFLNRTKYYFGEKNKLFSNFNDLTITCVSTWLADLALGSKYFKDKNVVTIYNGVDSDFYKDQGRERYFDLCFISNEWTSSKGLDMLKQIVNKLQDYKVLIVGKLNSDFTFPKNVTYMNKIDKKEGMLNLYNSVKYIVNISKQETFSLINIEAQLCGTPVISYSKTGMSETISPHNSVRVNNYCESEFLSAIKRAFANEKVDNYPRLFALNFSESNMIKNYKKLYDDIVERGK